MCHHTRHSHFRKRWYFLFLLIPVLIFGVVAVIMLLWNALLPNIFNIGTITFWQAFGLFILSRILFGGFRCGTGNRYRHHRSMHHLKDKWNSMSEEERAKYKEEWKKCCSHDDEEK